MPFEAINALKYSGQYEGDRLDEASESFPEYGINLVRLNTNGPVADIPTELDITIYDASYIALAQNLDTKAYTAHEQLLDELEGDYSKLVEHIRTYER